MSFLDLLLANNQHLCLKKCCKRDWLLIFTKMNKRANRKKLLSASSMTASIMKTQATCCTPKKSDLIAYFNINANYLHWFCLHSGWATPSFPAGQQAHSTECSLLLCSSVLLGGGNSRIRKKAEEKPILGNQPLHIPAKPEGISRTGICSFTPTLQRREVFDPSVIRRSFKILWSVGKSVETTLSEESVLMIFRSHYIY